MHILTTDIVGNPNVGLNCYCTDSYCLVPEGIPEHTMKEISATLKVEVHEISIAGTSLIGAFLAGNNSMLLVPEIIFEHEEKMLKDAGIEYTIIPTRLTALGNNIICNDAGAIVNPSYTNEEIEVIKKALNVPVKRGTIIDLEIVGSLAIATETHGLVGNDVTDQEKELLEQTLSIKVGTGTVNFGSPYISSGIVVNKNGFVTGTLSSGPELANADEALGFIE